MKVFIQCRRTKEFFAGKDCWTPTRATAMDCRTSLLAEEIIKREKLTGSAIVLTFDQGRETVIIPLSLVEDRARSTMV